MKIYRPVNVKKLYLGRPGAIAISTICTMTHTSKISLAIICVNRNTSIYTINYDWWITLRSKSMDKDHKHWTTSEVLISNKKQIRWVCNKQRMKLGNQKNETIPWSHFSQQETWIKTCIVSFIFVVPDYEACRVKKINGSHCMHKWGAWLEKNKVAWFSQGTE